MTWTMTRTMTRTMKGSMLRMLPAGLVLLLSACASTTDLVPHCCYPGEAALARLENVQLVMDDGSVATVAETLPGFAPSTGLFTKPFDFRRLDIARVTYASLQPVLPLYDANGDGRLDEPEITVMYLREAARGLGHEVDHLTVDGERADAITVARADVGGLMSYIERNLDAMPPEAQAIFRDLELVGLDIRRRAERDSGERRFTP